MKIAMAEKKTNYYKPREIRQRFEIKNGKIRAMYGHSKVKVVYKEDEYTKPPDVLYHGTAEETLESILKEGIKRKERMFVHLTEDLDEAYKIGRRHSKTPKVLVIDAKKAYAEGIRFIGKEGIYLADYIPAKFLSCLQDRKSEIREKVWHFLEEKRIALNCFGRIPDFKGKEDAAKQLSKQDFFKKATCIFCAPDGSLSSIRRIVLEEKKTLVVALPRMRGFVEIDERKNIKEAITIKGFFKYGKPLSGKKIELFIQGAVAVDRAGNRLGKGSGFGDKEWSWLKERGLIDNTCKVVCLVHKEQVLDEDLEELMQPHDKKVDYIITPEEVIKTKE